MVNNKQCRGGGALIAVSTTHNSKCNMDLETDV